ncbi:MAG: hypothetical protein AB7O67_13810 [Vicinamibacterales bacterium]
MATELSRDDLKRLARLGAMKRLEEIRKEEAAIRAAFPELFNKATAAMPAGATAEAPKRQRRQRKMSASARKAVSDRMKKYWADRRKAKR